MKTLLNTIWKSISQLDTSARRKQEQRATNTRPLSGASRCVWQLDSEA